MVEAGGGFHYNNARFNQDIRSINRPIRGLYGDTMAPALFVEGLRGGRRSSGPSGLGTVSARRGLGSGPVDPAVRNRVRRRTSPSRKGSAPIRISASPISGPGRAVSSVLRSV